MRAAIADSEFAAPRKPRASPLYVAAAAGAGLVVGAAAQWIMTPLAAQSTPPALPRRQPAPAAGTCGAGVSPWPSRSGRNARRASARAALERGAGTQAGRYSTPAGQQLLAERLAATRELLERADDERYALEFFLTENADPGRMERFLLRAVK